MCKGLTESALAADEVEMSGCAPTVSPQALYPHLCLEIGDNMEMERRSAVH